MTVARKKLVGMHISRYYHCISRCVRKAMLCGEGYEYRKQWIEDRIEVLAEVYAIGVCGFAVMDNHLHLLARLEPERARSWSAEEVVRRWIRIYTPKGLDLQDPVAVRRYVRKVKQDPKEVDKLRDRLMDLGWFMKSLKEPISRMANKEDGCRGAFWESRYKSIAILDEQALLATCAYIDLNPVAAGVARLPETSRHTSIRQRVLHVRRRSGGVEKLKAARRSAAAGCQALGDWEDDHWLCPFQDRSKRGSQRAGMFRGFSLGSYLLLVDYTSRLLRPGKARVPAEVREILDRLGTDIETWSDRLRHLLGRDRIHGTYFTTDRSRLRDLAQQQGCHHLANLAGCKA